jgi:hypothetical protein
VRLISALLLASCGGLVPPSGDYATSLGGVRVVRLHRHIEHLLWHRHGCIHRRRLELGAGDPWLPADPPLARTLGWPAGARRGGDRRRARLRTLARGTAPVTRLLLAIVLAGCATTSTGHQEAGATRSLEREVSRTAAVTETVEVRHEAGPVERTTVVEEYDPPGPQVSPAPPRLRRRVVTVEHVGAIVTEVRAAATSTASSLAETHATSTTASEADQRRDVKPAASCAVGGVVWGVAAVALLLLGVGVWRRMRL